MGELESWNGDSKEIWEAIRTSSEGLEKDRQIRKNYSLQLKALVLKYPLRSNHKFLRSLPSAWSNLAMTMRTKPDVDTLSIDDLYNNLRVFEQELTSTSKSSASAQNVAFVSHSKSSTNKVKSGHTGAYSTYTPSTSSNNIPEREVPAGFADEECTSKGTNDGKKRDSFYQDQGAGKKKHNQNCLLTMDDGVVNWGEHTVEEVETNHTLMAISSNNEVNKKQKYLPIIKLQINYMKKDEKLKKYRRIGMKAVKEKEQLQKTVDSWKDSFKNLWKLVNYGMTSNSKVGLGYGIKSNNEVLSYEEEMNRTVFNCIEEDFVDKPLYNRFLKTDNLKGVPHPLTGDYTPKPQQEIDESLYVYGKKGPQKPKTSFSDDKFNEYSVTTNEKVMSEPKPKEVEPSCVTHVKTPRQPMKNQETPKVNGKNWNEIMERELGEGYSFIKKKCFVCGNLSHLIRDCDFYEKKMAREAELKKQRVFNTGTIPSMKAADAKKAIQDIADHSQKWHNETSTKCRSTKTYDGLVAIEAQLNNLGREIKKVNKKVYAA
ncbi:ribonuclease H-like domain-containing protein [Tanacetum coccineum]